MFQAEYIFLEACAYTAKSDNFDDSDMLDIGDIGLIRLWPGICAKYFLSFPQKNLPPEKTETN